MIGLLGACLRFRLHCLDQGTKHSEYELDVALAEDGKSISIHAEHHRNGDIFTFGYELEQGEEFDPEEILAVLEGEAEADADGGGDE